MPEIKIAVINKVPKIVGDIRCIVADNSDYTIRFTFDDMWEDGAKTVYFVRENGFAFPVGRTEDDTVTIPIQHEPAMHSMLFVGVQQGNVKTSRPVEIRIASSITDMITDDAVQPEPTMWEGVLLQIAAMQNALDEKVDGDQLGAAVTDALTEAKESGEFNGPPGPPGSNYVLTEDDKKEIASMVEVTGGSSIDVTASPGQTIRVTEVDEDGKPTAWEAADYQPRTHWSEPVDESNLLYELPVVFTDSAALLASPLTGIIIGNTYRVNWNGVDYTCTACGTDIGVGVQVVSLGDLGAAESGTPVTGEPFVILASPVVLNGIWSAIYALDGSTEALVKISAVVTEKIHPLPNKYLDLHWIPSAEEVEYVKDLYVPESPYTTTDYPELAEYVKSIGNGCEIAITIDGVRSVCVLAGDVADGYFAVVTGYIVRIVSSKLIIESPDGDTHTVSISGFRYPSIPAGMIREHALPQPVRNNVGSLMQIKAVSDGGDVTELDALPFREGEYTAGMMSTSAASVEFVQSGVELARKEASDKAKELSEAIADLAEPSPRYGVSGVGGSNTALTRIWDAAGLTAMVGTDVPGIYYNDFDNLAPFNRRKCVGTWSQPDESGKAHFTVKAYCGDPDYTEDGTMGDYVAVEVEPFWFYQNLDDGVIGVSPGEQAGWSVHPVCVDEDGNVREKTYLPCYALAVNEAGDAVSLPGYHTSFGNYQGLRSTCRTYGGGNNAAHLEPMAVRHYEWLLFTIEFATTHCQSVMMGAASMPYSADDKVALDGTDVDHVVVTAAIGNKFVVGQTIYIGTTHSTSASADELNIITAIEPCDPDGTPNESGTYRRITYSGRTNTVTAGTTTISTRPWITGSCNDVTTPSGSPVSNTSGKYPMRYRYRENIWANCYSTCNDLFDQLAGAGTTDDPYHIIWHHLIDPDWYPASSSRPNATDFASESFKQLAQVTEHKDGYIKQIEADPDHPECIVPVSQTGGGSSTYFADYAYFVNGTTGIRLVRFGGSVTTGSNSGVLCFLAYYPVSNAPWSYGGGLYMRQ